MPASELMFSFVAFNLNWSEIIPHWQRMCHLWCELWVLCTVWSIYLSSNRKSQQLAVRFASDYPKCQPNLQGKKTIRIISKSKSIRSNPILNIKSDLLPVSITHNRSHSSTRIRNVDIMVELSANWPSTPVAFGAFVRPPLLDSEAESPSDCKKFACHDGYGISFGVVSLLSIFM